MLAQLTIGGLLIFLSVALQTAFIGAAIEVGSRLGPWAEARFESVRRALFIGAVALWMSAAHGVSIWLWAAAFLGLGVFEDLDTAFYFSAVAFTTLGFGDIIPPEEWRHLAGLCAANGLLLFGVSAAVLVEAFRETRSR